ncbi:MAG: hypothetical protein FD149_2535 [Rhodospirillaceae bacterium]|nr:MAG: hypothetical protein FD149_2535 [Rhodospirillaceae bacterium]
MSVSTFDATEDIDLFVASHVFAHNARPLFAVLDETAERIVWRAGGCDFPELSEGPGQDSLELADILAALGVEGADIPDVRSSLLAADPGAAAGFPRRLTSAGGRSLGLVSVHRPAPDGRIQFSLIDITAFVAAERRGREMAARILEALEQGDESALSALDVVTRGVRALATLPDDDAVATVARQLSDIAEHIIVTSIATLRVFEADWIEPPPFFPDAMPIWGGAWDDARSGHIPTHSLRDARDFVRHAIPTFLISPQGREVICLNRSLDGRRLPGIDALVRELGVEDNSIRTATDFFSGLRTGRDVATFAMRDTTIEARGQPLVGGGWQATLVPAMTEAVDVRGLFHGFKNLLLHLQVLHVVRTRADVVHVDAGLRDTVARLQTRVTFLRAIARGSHIDRQRRPETVRQWVRGAVQVASELGRALTLDAEDTALDMTYLAPPEEMEDTLAEVARNAYQHGATHVHVAATTSDRTLAITVVDDGRGVTPDKLGQIRRMLETHRYDATLTTRHDGTGNGLLSAAKAVGRFVDGRLTIDHGPGGRGTLVCVAMKRAA